MQYIKIDPSCLTSKQSLEYLISNISQHKNAIIYVTTTQNAVNNIDTVLQGAMMQDAHAYTMLRSMVLEYKNIFSEIENIHAKIETF